MIIGAERKKGFFFLHVSDKVVAWTYFFRLGVPITSLHYLPMNITHPFCRYFFPLLSAFRAISTSKNYSTDEPQQLVFISKTINNNNITIDA